VIELAAASLRASGSLTMRVWGSSMLPAIQPGDIVAVRRAEMAEACIGDVILCKRNGRFFAHRMVARHGDAVVTRGDAVRAEDPPVQAHEVLGIVTCAPRTRRDRIAATLFRHSRIAARLYMRLACT
jgi:signal peptidase